MGYAYVTSGVFGLSEESVYFGGLKKGDYFRYKGEIYFVHENLGQTRLGKDVMVVIHNNNIELFKYSRKNRDDCDFFYIAETDNCPEKILRKLDEYSWRVEVDIESEGVLSGYELVEELPLASLEKGDSYINYAGDCYTVDSNNDSVCIAYTDDGKKDRVDYRCSINANCVRFNKFTINRDGHIKTYTRIKRTNCWKETDEEN